MACRAIRALARPVETHGLVRLERGPPVHHRERMRGLRNGRDGVHGQEDRTMDSEAV